MDAPHARHGPSYSVLCFDLVGAGQEVALEGPFATVFDVAARFLTINADGAAYGAFARPGAVESRPVLRRMDERLMGILDALKAGAVEMHDVALLEVVDELRCLFA